ncbi:uncharacterized protein LOC131527498 isoform X2 [Onychostoma macrolepis]|uniref:uncharacterized protein LOC131527498 isoform X2 n=1 Tax=Onychostoma macrolepis TaxID=369639 RepID=UPI002729708B|nr:uncharacterized protein LOC131527498 isoform X2 [Onychostoma macrolepis]
MESKMLIYDLFSWIPKEYNKLLRKADELVKIVSRLECWPNIYAIYLKDYGQFGPIEFINTCVPDSYLMALYICYIHHDHIASLFNSFEKLRAPMVFLRARMYNEAKASWLFWCNVTVKNTENYKYVTDAWSNPNDHLHMFDELIVSNNNLRFERLGNVHALGFSDLHPLLILVEINPAMDTAPPLYIDDDYDRSFELQFLLMTRTSLPSHLIVGLNIFDRWVLYDNSKLPYDPFNPKNADFRGDFTILLIAYVNIAQDHHYREVPFELREERHYGTIPFDLSHGSNNQKEHSD